MQDVMKAMLADFYKVIWQASIRIRMKGLKAMQMHQNGLWYDQGFYTF